MPTQIYAYCHHKIAAKRNVNVFNTVWWKKLLNTQSFFKSFEKLWRFCDVILIQVTISLRDIKYVLNIECRYRASRNLSTNYVT